MYDRMQTFSSEELTKIHQASMELLDQVGVTFMDDEAVEIFKANGARVDGRTVFLTEAQVQKALDQAPAHFQVRARNPEQSVAIGGDDFVLLPGYGAPFISEIDGSQRPATMADYDKFVKLVQTSDQMDMNGFMMIEPHDRPAETVHLDLLLSGLTGCDKPLMGSPVSKQASRECVEMLKLVFGPDLAEGDPATVSLINSLSPLQFSDEMAGSLIELVRGGQAVVIAALIMAGSSGPVTLAGVAALQNAEILAGLTLAQLIRPGAPVIYGSTSSAMDMRTGALSIGAPELSMMVSLAAQMARFYNLPCRSGGGLTDALLTDAQAGIESSLALTTAIRSGVNFILHAAGILGAYISMSFEKFIVDEELCRLTRKLIAPITITDETIDLEMIKTVGIGGQYLTQPKTFKLCRTEFYLTQLMNRANEAGWAAAGSLRLDAQATQLVDKRLAAYEKPAIDQGLEKELEAFVASKK